MISLERWSSARAVAACEGTRDSDEHSYPCAADQKKRGTVHLALPVRLIRTLGRLVVVVVVDRLHIRGEGINLRVVRLQKHQARSVREGLMIGCHAQSTTHRLRSRFCTGLARLRPGEAWLVFNVRNYSRVRENKQAAGNGQPLRCGCMPAGSRSSMRMHACRDKTSREGGN